MTDIAKSNAPLVIRSQHTPSPWRIVRGGDCVCDHAGMFVANVRQGQSSFVSEQDRANARLIAAAPEMLEALQYVMSAHGEQLHDAFDMAHKAIAKATGSEPGSPVVRPQQTEAEMVQSFETASAVGS